MLVNETALAEEFTALCAKHGAVGGIVFWNRDVEMAVCICAFNSAIGELLEDIQASAEKSFLMKHPEAKIQMS